MPDAYGILTSTRGRGCVLITHRTKTQGSFSTEEAGLTLLYGLVAFGQITMRRIDGYKHVVELLAERQDTAA